MRRRRGRRRARPLRVRGGPVGRRRHLRLVRRAPPCRRRSTSSRGSAGLRRASTCSKTQAAALRPGESGLLALDWWNGNRSVLVDAELARAARRADARDAPAEIYRALIEATAFGTRVIVDAFERPACPSTDRGLRRPAGAQPAADADLRRRARARVGVAASQKAPALGAAMFGAVAGGASARSWRRQSGWPRPSPRHTSRTPEPARVRRALCGVRAPPRSLRPRRRRRDEDAEAHSRRDEGSGWPETLRQVEAHAREVAAGLGAQPAVPVRMVHADVLGRPIGVAASQNAPALGAAMFGAAAGGACRSIGEVSERMAAVAAGTYLPVNRRSSYQGGEVDPGALGHTLGRPFLTAFLARADQDSR